MTSKTGNKHFLVRHFIFVSPQCIMSYSNKTIMIMWTGKLQNLTDNNEYGVQKNAHINFFIHFF